MVDIVVFRLVLVLLLLPLANGTLQLAMLQALVVSIVINISVLIRNTSTGVRTYVMAEEAEPKLVLMELEITMKRG